MNREVCNAYCCWHLPSCRSCRPGSPSPVALPSRARQAQPAGPTGPAVWQLDSPVSLRVATQAHMWGLEVSRGDASLIVILHSMLGAYNGGAVGEPFGG